MIIPERGIWEWMNQQLNGWQGAVARPYLGEDGMRESLRLTAGYLAWIYMAIGLCDLMAEERDGVAM